jgi:hypothetical protein
MSCEHSVRLENDRLGLSFDRKTGTLTAIHNKLVGETYRIRGDEFQVKAVEFDFASGDATLTLADLQQETFRARYQGPALVAEVSYTLRGENAFAEKRIVLTSNRDYGLKHLVLSRPSFSAANLEVVPYRYQKNVTFFGRTPKGGFFTGVELPFAAVSADGDQVVLGYATALKVKAAEKLESEPIYFGVYQRYPDEPEEQSQPFYFTINRYPGTPKLKTIPRRSESDAIVAMTSALLGPPRHGLVPMACGWHCEMEQRNYRSDEAVEEDVKSLQFLAECGIDWLADSHPWGGETEKMNSLVGEQGYEPGPLASKLLQHAQQVGVNVVLWSTMNHTHPWWRSKGQAFRPDKPEWIMIPGGVERNLEVNCFANAPFFDWLVGINQQALATGYYHGWAMDGSFFGHGEYGRAFVPVDCPSGQHDHLPGDSNYACLRNLNELMARVRQQDPDVCIMVCGPPMDLGVWSLKNVDACFTIDECAKLEYLVGLATQPVNVALGDKIRNWSRVRVHHHFYPHYIDQPLLFPSRADRNAPSSWPREKIDYIVLSALSCSPNQLFYLPTKTGIPDEDKAEIRKWLDWGRKNIDYLMVRKDLPDWPAAGKVDGSAHVIGGKGIVFLFNPNKETLQGAFELSAEEIGLRQEGTYEVWQEHPASAKRLRAQFGGSVHWEVPGESAAVLRLTRNEQ